MMTEKKIPEIKKIEHWVPQHVKDFCTENSLYSCGADSDYTAMLTFVKHHEPTTENLYIVAEDILKHSSDRANRVFIVSDIMTFLMKQTVVLNYIVED